MLKNKTLTYVTRWASRFAARVPGSQTGKTVLSVILPLMALPLSLHGGSLVITFDDLPLGNPGVDGSEAYGDPPEYYFNGSGKADPTAPIQSGEAALANNYNSQWGSWSGWAYSNTTDTTTPGFQNQYSNITGSGRNSEAFGIFYPNSGGGNAIDFASALDLSDHRGMYITNTTYAYSSMRDGDQFAKAFGGPDGNDPDYLLVRATGLLAGEVTGTSEFYLGDYRFDKNELDYLVDSWEFWNLQSLGTIDGIRFTFEGSDTGQFLNTPSYFAMDDFGAQIPEPRAGALLLLGVLAGCIRRSRRSRRWARSA
jgi:hypothetical protein